MFSDSIFIMIIAAFIGTYLTRILPYWLFKNKQESKNLAFLQLNMPLVIIIVLFFYTFYDINFTQAPYGLDVICACIFVFVLHYIFKNSLLSIIAGTVFYMILLNIIDSDIFSLLI